MLDTDRNTNQIRRDARAELLLVRKLLVGGGGGVDGEGLGITNIGKVGDELEVVDNVGTSLLAALDTKGQDTAEAALQVLEGNLVAGVALEAGV